MTSPAQELTAAAQKLRNARFTGAVTMTPAVAALVAARGPIAHLLESANADAERLGRATGSPPGQCLNPDILAVARAILGDQP